MMDKNVLTKFISIYMILLLVFIPVKFSLLTYGFERSFGPGYSGPGGSGLEGSTLAIRSIQGNDGIEGFRRSSDKVKIVAQARLGDNITVTPENLEVYFEGWAEGTFDSCTLVSPQQFLYECEFNDLDSEMSPVSAGVLTYEVRLTKDYEFQSSATRQITVDNLAPRIDTFNLETRRTNKENISLSFSVRDLAYSGVSGIGIKSLLITSNGDEIYKYPKEEVNESLAITRKTTINDNIIVPLRRSSGMNRVCISAIDYFDLKVERCLDVEVDLDAPRILVNTLKVVGNDGEPYDWVTDKEFPLVVSVNYLAPDLELNSIYANFSNINTNPINNLKGDCQLFDEDEYQCTFRVNARVNDSSSKSIVFYGEDDLGNSVIAHATTSFRYDATPPVARVLTTPHYYNGFYFIGNKPTKVSINFEETGIGMNKSLAFANFADIGFSSMVKADECEPSWICHWYNVIARGEPGQTWRMNNDSRFVSGKESEIIVLPTTSDDIENFAETKRFTVIVDTYAPEIDSYTIVSIPGNENDFGDEFTVEGDSIYIEFNLTEASFVDMTIKGRDFISNFEDTVRCEDNLDGTHRCQYILGPIENKGPYRGNLIIEFTDIVGNTHKHEEIIEVFGIDERDTNYWSARAINCLPNPLDRQLVEKISTDAYCPVELMAGPNIEIFDITEGSCSLIDVKKAPGVSDEIKPALRHYNWMGLGRKGRSIYLNLLINSFNPRINGMTYSCQVHVRSLVNKNVLTRKYQAVNVTAEFSLFNNPIGEMSDEVWNEVTGIYEQYIGGGWTIVGYLHSVFDLSNKICNLFNKLIRLIDGFKLIIGVNEIYSASMKSNPVTTTAGTSLGAVNSQLASVTETANEATKKGWRDMGNTFCKFVSCRLGFFPAYQNALAKVMALMINPLQMLEGRRIDDDTGEQSGVGTAFDVLSRTISMASNSDITNIGANPFGMTSDEKRDYRAETYFLGNSLVKPKLDMHATSYNPDAKLEEQATAAAADEDKQSVWAEIDLPVSAYDNYVAAVLSLCIPGIINNLEKYRQIQCEYGLCLLRTVQGVQIDQCQANKGYAECKFIYGPLFELIPFSGFISKVQRAVAQIMTSPELLVDIALNVLCKTQLGAKMACGPTPTICTAPTWALLGCWLYETWGFFSDIIADVRGVQEHGLAEHFGFGEGSMKLGANTGVCKDFAEKYEELAGKSES